jgi:hypothetical protein
MGSFHLLGNIRLELFPKEKVFLADFIDLLRIRPDFIIRSGNRYPSIGAFKERFVGFPIAMQPHYRAENAKLKPTDKEFVETWI